MKPFVFSPAVFFVDDFGSFTAGVLAILLLVGIGFLIWCCLRNRQNFEKEVERRVSERTRENLESIAELKKRQAVVEILSEISTRFITLEPSRIDAEIPEAIGKIATALNAQRASIHMPPENADMESEDFFVDLTYYWRAEGYKPEDGEVPRVYLHRFPWVKERFFKGEPAFVTDVSMLPDWAGPEVKFLNMMKWKSIAIIPVFVENRLLGNLNFIAKDNPLSWPVVLSDELRIVGEIFANAIERKRRSQLLRALQSDRIEAEERERTRISRELHDQLGGSLTGLKMQSKALQLKLSEEAPDLVPLADRISEIVDETLPDIRRICAELRPVVLDELDLIEALDWQTQQFTKNTGLPCKFDFSVKKKVLSDKNLETALFRITQELLTNVSRHAEASEVKISINESESGDLILTIADDGVGLVDQSMKTNSQGLGLRGIRERMEYIGGEFTLETPETGGTLATVRVPRATWNSEGT